MCLRHGVIWLPAFSRTFQAIRSLITKVGLPYVGRRGVYEKDEANILFVLGQLKACNRTPITVI